MIQDSLLTTESRMATSCPPGQSDQHGDAARCWLPIRPGCRPPHSPFSPVATSCGCWPMASTSLRHATRRRTSLPRATGSHPAGCHRLGVPPHSPPLAAARLTLLENSCAVHRGTARIAWRAAACTSRSNAAGTLGMVPCCRAGLCPQCITHTSPSRHASWRSGRTDARGKCCMSATSRISWAQRGIRHTAAPKHRHLM